MAFWSNWFKRSSPEERAVEAPAVVDGIATASTIGRQAPRRGTRELIAAYREQPQLRAVTSRIARGVASAGWRVYARAAEPMRGAGGAIRTRQGPNGRVRDVIAPPAFRWGVDVSVRDAVLQSGDFEARCARRRELAAAGLLREVTDHPLLDLLTRPNADLTGRGALSVSQIWLDIKGEAFWLLTKGADGVPTGYFPIPPHWVIAIPTEGSPFFRVSFNAVQLQVPADQVIWLRDLDPENPYARGTGVAESLGDELETDEYAAKYLKAWFYNSGLPAAIVSFDGVAPADVKRAKEQWEQDHRGFGNAHRVFFGAGKMNAQRFDASFRDQQLPELRKLQRDFVMQVFAVPPEIMGIIENSNRATITAARYIYVLGVELPRCEFLRTELQHRLCPKFKGDAVLDYEVPIPDDESHRLAVMQALPGAFALNEWRAEAGYEPQADFDGVFPPLAMPGQVHTPVGQDEDEDPEVPDGPIADSPADEGRALALRDPPWARRAR